MTCLDYCIPNRASVAQEATVCTGVGSSRVGRCWTGDIRDNRGDIATRLHTVRVADLLPLLLPSLHLFFFRNFPYSTYSKIVLSLGKYKGKYNARVLGFA